MATSKQHAIKVLINKDDWEWFRETYPGSSFSWLFELLLEKFREVHSKTPADYAALGAAEVKKALEER